MEGGEGPRGWSAAIHKRRWYYLILGWVLVAGGFVEILRGSWAIGLAVTALACIPLTLSAFALQKEMGTARG